MWVRFGGKVSGCDGSKDCGGLAMVSEVALYVCCYADLYICTSETESSSQLRKRCIFFRLIITTAARYFQSKPISPPTSTPDRPSFIDSHLRPSLTPPHPPSR